MMIAAGMALEPESTQILAPEISQAPWYDLAWGKVVLVAPTVAWALLLLAGGWLLASLLRRLVARGLGATGLDAAVQPTRMGRILESFSEDMTPSRAVGGLVYIAVLLLAATSAAAQLGLVAVAAAVESALAYLPRLGAALLVVAIGGYVGGMARRAVGAVMHEMRSPLAGPLESAAELSLLGLSVIIAVDLLGIDISFITSSLGLALGVGLVTVALLFAWSMRRPAEEIVANYYLRRMVQLGDEIELGEVRGTAERFSPLGVLVRADDGQQHFIPARHVLAGLSRRTGPGPG